MTPKTILTTSKHNSYSHKTKTVKTKPKMLQNKTKTVETPADQNMKI
jgi:hypothetical protein